MPRLPGRTKPRVVGVARLAALRARDGPSDILVGSARASEFAGGSAGRAAAKKPGALT